jgi:hypothetical protein
MYDFKTMNVICLNENTYFDTAHTKNFRPTGVLLEKFKEFLNI